jgi:undecaprenyl-diphosphatase
MEGLLALDTRLFLAINGLNGEIFDKLMWWISGKYTWWPFYLAVLGILAWKKGWQLLPMILFIALVVALTDQTSVHLFKNVFQRLRPCHEPSLEGMVHLVNNKCGGKYGFISSHAANVAGVALLLLDWYRSKLFAGVMILWAFLVGYSRIYLGVHYPSDVLAGWVWGLLCGWLVYRLFCLLMNHLPPSWWISGKHTVSGSS